MEVMNKIYKVIDTSVRPYLQGHGGDIQVLDFTDGILRFKLTGMCSNCPSSLFTTEDIVKKELTEQVEEVKEVRLEAGVSDEMIDFAKRLLRHELG
ncbi:MAG: NifU family protein [Frisingicoccus sp.]|uniref:NifU family protein n=1 Tax=Frisingicoccus sp. TaxID=1918627 RepID=UPI002A7FCD48|nr:NifU family protein [Frisingicoccus sp.]MDY4835578.1 NifU family protein [Frisingicoccus sp.]